MVDVKNMKFPEKLWRLVNECKSGAIGWGKDNAIVIDQVKFGNEILGKRDSIFKTQSFDSFIRQLNLYGFRKCNRLKDVHEFKHSCFVQGKKELLVHLRRKYTYGLYSEPETSRKSATKKPAKRFNQDHSYQNIKQNSDSSDLSPLHLLNAMTASNNCHWLASSQEDINRMLTDRNLGHQESLGLNEKEESEGVTDVGKSIKSEASPKSYWLGSTFRADNRMFGGKTLGHRTSGNLHIKEDSEDESEESQSNNFWDNLATHKKVVFVPVPVPAHYGCFPGFYTDTLDSMFDSLNKSSAR